MHPYSCTDKYSTPHINDTDAIYIYTTYKCSIYAHATCTTVTHTHTPQHTRYSDQVAMQFCSLHLRLVESAG